MKYWKTKEGKFIPINELTDSHLVNIWNMISKRVFRRSVTEIRVTAEMFLQGDMGLLSVEEQFDEHGNSMDDYCNPHVYLLHPKLDAIYSEIVNRSLLLNVNLDKLSEAKKGLNDYIDKCNVRENMDWLPFNKGKNRNE